jgi:hypothetical protein
MGDLDAIVAETQRVLQPIIAKVRRCALSTTFWCGVFEAFARISARERGRRRKSPTPSALPGCRTRSPAVMAQRHRHKRCSHQERGWHAAELLWFLLGVFVRCSCKWWMLYCVGLPPASAQEEEFREEVHEQEGQGGGRRGKRAINNVAKHSFNALACP